MVSHPPKERSACRAAPSDPNKLRRFPSAVVVRGDFILGRAAVQYLRRQRPQWSKAFRAMHSVRRKTQSVLQGVAEFRRGRPENEKPADTAGLRQTLPLQENLERAKGFEPSTPTLARSCSTTELHPHPRDWRRAIAGNGQSYAKCGPRMQQLVRDPESAGYSDRKRLEPGGLRPNQERKPSALSGFGALPDPIEVSAQAAIW